MDPKVPMMVLVLLKWVAPNPPTKLALKPKFNWVVVLALPEWVGLNPMSKLAIKPKFKEVSKLNKALA